MKGVVLSESSLLIGKIRSALAPCTLGTWPTPLEPAGGLAEANGLAGLWLKREDRSSIAYGGNKVRGLEFLLADAIPGMVFVTLGGTGSTHCLATAIHAASLSCRTVVAQFPQPATEASRAVAAACERAAERVVRARSRASLPLAVVRAWLAARRLGDPRWVPGGGADPRAVAGHLVAGLELAAQLPGPPPDAIVTPLGSGGTAAGLVLAMGALAWPTRVVAVRVAPRIVANRWRVAALARATLRLLAMRDVPISAPSSLFPEVVQAAGAGYGHPTPAGETARALASGHGIELDPTYGAKAFSTLPGLAARGFEHIVFWHTFAFPPRPAESRL